MKIAKGLRVRLKTKLSVVEGDVLEESVVEYFQGAGTMLSGLEEVLVGLQKGDKRQGVLKAEDAFGAEEHQVKKDIPRDEFPKEVDLKVGSSFAATGPNGMNVILRVESIDDDAVHALYLHPLHNKDIEFDVEVLGVSDPKPPPLPADAVASDADSGDQ